MEIDSSSSVESVSPPPSVPTGQNNPPETQQQPTLTSSDRIADLNEIDTSVSTLLSSASRAISILSNQSQSSSPTLSLDHSKTDFTAASQLYFSTLSQIEVRLRRQVYALEEAGLIPAGDERDTRRGRNLNNDEAGTAGGRRSDGVVGAGALDPSWLNARVVDRVEQAKKREVLDAAKAFVLETRERNGGSDDSSKHGNAGGGGEDAEMKDDET